MSSENGKIIDVKRKILENKYQYSPSILSRLSEMNAQDLENLNEIRNRFLKNEKRDIMKDLETHDPSFAFSDDVKNRFQEMLKENTVENTIKKMGYNVYNYEDLLYSGVMNMKENLKDIPNDIICYVEKFWERLHPDVRKYFLNYAKFIQSELESWEYLNYYFDYASSCVILSTYLLRTEYGGPPEETPILMIMRIAVQLYHNDSIEMVLKCFREISNRLYTPASPTIFNAGTKRPQMSSCFIMSVGDNLDSILSGLHTVGMISKTTGAIGVDMSNIRHSQIDKVGMSSGITRPAKLYDGIAEYVDQGGGKRKGALSLFLRPHHIDIVNFINLVDKIGDHNDRIYTASNALWIPWIFYERVEQDGDWTMFCPAKVPQLNNVYGNEFTKLYIEAENDTSIDGDFKKVMKARTLYDKIIKMQRIAGMPYIMNADTSNIRSAHKHLGYIRSSNLCLEIIEYTDEDTINVCNLSSICLSSFSLMSDFNEKGFEKGLWFSPVKTLQDAVKRINWKGLSKIAGSVTKNLNRVVDNNYYPLDKDNGKVLERGPIHKTNMMCRAIGIGPQGLAELLYKIDLDYLNPIALKVEELITACMYFNSIAMSVQLSIKEGVCDIFEGSTYSEGKFQFDLAMEEYMTRWPNDGNSFRTKDDNLPVNPSEWKQRGIKLLDRYEKEIDHIDPTWEDLKRVVMKYGMRNSLLIAFMPTASTSKYMRNTEASEIRTSNIYSAKLLSGSFPIVNRYMYFDLKRLGLLKEYVIDFIISNEGRLSGITEFIKSKQDIGVKTTERLNFLEKKYITMFEIPMRDYLWRAAVRGKYVDQSQSTSVFIDDATDEKLCKLHLYTNKIGLKTQMYYLRTRSAYEAAKFTISDFKDKNKREKNINGNKVQCDGDVCISCQ